MGNVPNILHFISPITQFTDVEIATIIEWAMLNVEYKTLLWLPAGLHQPLADAFRRVIPLRVSSVEITEQTDFGKITMSWKGQADEQVSSVSIEDFSSVPARCPVEALETLLVKFEKKHVVRDIAALWVLYAHGGIFVDTNTHTGGRSLPLGINAPAGILLAKFHRSHPQLVNNIMAAPPKSEAVGDLHYTFTRSYVGHFTLRPDKPPVLCVKVFKQFAMMRRHEEYIKLQQRPELLEFCTGRNIELLKTRRELEKLREKLGVGTLHNSSVIRWWVTHQLKDIREEYEQLYTRTEEELARLTVAETYSEEEFIKSSQERSAIYMELSHRESVRFLEYSFQDATNFHPVIPSSAIGLKPTVMPEY